MENLESENKKLKSQYLKCFADWKVMKEKEAEEEKMQWHREALSDKNPYLMEQFRKKIDEKEKEIKRLAKNLKKVIILINIDYNNGKEIMGEREGFRSGEEWIFR